jgi:putative membrane protein
MMWYWRSGWDWLWMTAMMLGFWALVAWLVVTLVRGGADPARSTSAPERILAERFARGEIDQDEYQQRLEALHGTARTGR